MASLPSGLFQMSAAGSDHRSSSPSSMSWKAQRNVGTHGPASCRHTALQHCMPSISSNLSFCLSLLIPHFGSPVCGSLLSLSLLCLALDSPQLICPLTVSFLFGLVRLNFLSGSQAAKLLQNQSKEKERIGRGGKFVNDMIMTFH